MGENFKDQAIIAKITDELLIETFNALLWDPYGEEEGTMYFDCKNIDVVMNFEEQGLFVSQMGERRQFNADLDSDYRRFVPIRGMHHNDFIQHFKGIAGNKEPFMTIVNKLNEQEEFDYPNFSIKKAEFLFNIAKSMNKLNEFYNIYSVVKKFIALDWINNNGIFREIFELKNNQISIIKRY